MSVHYFSECLRENMAEAKKHHKLPFAFRVFSAVLGWVFIIKQKRTCTFPNYSSYSNSRLFKLRVLNFFSEGN